MSPEARPLATVYEDLWQTAQLEEWLLATPALQPRSPGSLFEMLTDIPLPANAQMLDAGCGQGNHSCELARRFGAQVTALDPLRSNLDVARQAVTNAGLASQVTVQQGTLEAMPFPAGSFDLVWCRGVIPHLASVTQAFRECRRVLRPGGFMLVHTGYAGPLLEPAEAAALYRRLGFVAESMQQAPVESAIREAGFTFVQNESLSSEYAEYYEQQEGRCAKYLLALARLLRAETQVIGRFGQQAYETTLGLFHWQLYQMLGKISYHAYLLQTTI